jgi:DNA primase
LLLNHPTAALELDITQLAGVDKPGIDLLQRLIETLHQEPNMTTAGLLERWRHDAAGKHLGKLAAAELPDDDEFDAAAELKECLAALAAVARRQHFDILIEKQRVNSLSEDEKAELRRLGRA